MILLRVQACLDLKLATRIKSMHLINNNNFEKENFIKKYSETFCGGVKLPGKCSVTTRENFGGQSHPPFEVPIAIRNELMKELDGLMHRNAINRIDNIIYDASINRMVIFENANGKIRLFLDPSDINNEIVRKP